MDAGLFAVATVHDDRRKQAISRPKSELKWVGGPTDMGRTALPLQPAARHLLITEAHRQSGLGEGRKTK